MPTTTSTEKSNSKEMNTTGACIERNLIPTADPSSPLPSGSACATSTPQGGDGGKCPLFHDGAPIRLGRVLQSGGMGTCFEASLATSPFPEEKPARLMMNFPNSQYRKKKKSFCLKVSKKMVSKSYLREQGVDVNAIVKSSNRIKEEDNDDDDDQFMTDQEFKAAFQEGLLQQKAHRQKVPTPEVFHIWVEDTSPPALLPSGVLSSSVPAQKLQLRLCIAMELCEDDLFNLSIKINTMLEESEKMGGKVQGTADLRRIQNLVLEIQYMIGILVPGVRKLHLAEIIHRDLKPENILYKKVLVPRPPNAATPTTPSTTSLEQSKKKGKKVGGASAATETPENEKCPLYFPYFADFGVSKEVTTKSKMRTGTICGTDRHMAPELHKVWSEKQKAYGPGVDFFALGTCILFLVNPKPFYNDMDAMGKKQQEDIDAIIEESMQRIETVANDTIVEEALPFIRQALNACLCINAAQRTKKVQDFVSKNQLDEFLKKEQERQLEELADGPVGAAATAVDDRIIASTSSTDGVSSTSSSTSSWIQVLSQEQKNGSGEKGQRLLTPRQSGSQQTSSTKKVKEFLSQAMASLLSPKQWQRKEPKPSDETTTVPSDQEEEENHSSDDSQMLQQALMNATHQGTVMTPAQDHECNIPKNGLTDLMQTLDLEG